MMQAAERIAVHKPHQVGRDMRPIVESRILIVDDEPMSCRLLAGLLRKQGFHHIEIANCGFAALQCLKVFQPDLILLDMQMPDLDGIEVCKRMRALPEFVDVPILIETATVDRKSMGELFAGGASDFLSKPISPMELISRVMLHLERGRLLAELREFRQRISEDLDASQRMQFDLLPSAALQDEVVHAAGLQIGSYHRSASEVGGDLWGILPIDDRSFGTFVADFTGHGVTAALNTFRLHALIHEYKHLHQHPAKLVAMLNERLSRLLPTGQFATFVYVVVAHADNELRFTSAGAPPAITQIGSGIATLTEAAGVPLGIVPGVQYDEHRVAFPPGSRLVLFSDGLSEFPAETGERYGDQWLADRISGLTAKLSAASLVEHLVRNVGISADMPLPDDTTVICIDWPAEKAPPP
jgi:sigma-B regulation protein RsbU (phosphoserine phosphatase)